MSSLKASKYEESTSNTHRILNSSKHIVPHFMNLLAAQSKKEEPTRLTKMDQKLNNNSSSHLHNRFHPLDPDRSGAAHPTPVEYAAYPKVRVD